MSDAFASQTHLEEDVTSEQAHLDLLNSSSNQYELSGNHWLTDLNADRNFDRFYARNNHSESDSTRHDFMQQNQVALLDGAYSLGYNFPCDFAIEGGPSSMDTGLHRAGIPDEPTIDPSWIRPVPGENSNGLLLSENVEFLQANELYSPESISNMSLEALDTAVVAAAVLRDMRAHTYPHTIDPGCFAKVQQAEMIKRIRSDFDRWKHPERDNRFQCKICQADLCRKDVLQRHFLSTDRCIKRWENMDVATQKSFDPSGRTV